ASVSDDKTTRLWKASTGCLIGLLRGHNDTVTCVTFFLSEKLHLITGSHDKTLRLWDISTGASLRTIDVPEKISGIAYSLDCKQFTTWSNFSESWQIWNISNYLNVVNLPKNELLFDLQNEETFLRKIFRKENTGLKIAYSPKQSK